MWFNRRMLKIPCKGSVENDDVLENMGTKNGNYISHRKEKVEYYKEDNEERILKNMIITRNTDVKKKKTKKKKNLGGGYILGLSFKYN